MQPEIIGKRTPEEGLNSDTKVNFRKRLTRWGSTDAMQNVNACYQTQ
jgi:hypothetical protein